MQKKYSDIMQEWIEEPDYCKETKKQYYQKFNLPESSIAIKVIDNYIFGARRRMQNFKFSSLDRKLILHR